MLDVALLG